MYPKMYDAAGGSWILNNDGSKRPYRFYHRVIEWVVDGWRNRHWRRRQAEFSRIDTRYYGDGGTLHDSPQLDVETDRRGKVVAVWFRCQLLPFKQRVVDEDRATQMAYAYTEPYIPELRGVEVRDNPKTYSMTAACP